MGQVSFFRKDVTLHFSCPHLEARFVAWTRDVTWNRSTVMCCLVWGLGIAQLTWTRMIDPAIFKRMLPVYSSFLCLSTIVAVLHLTAVRVSKLRFFVRHLSFFNYCVLFGLFQWLFMIAVPDPALYVLAHTIIFNVCALGPRFRFSAMICVVLITSASFLYLYIATFRQGWTLYSEGCLLVMMGHSVLYILGLRGQELLYRKEYLRSNELEQTLAERIEENTQLRLDAEKLKSENRALLEQQLNTTLKRPKIELRTPLEQVLSTLQSIRESCLEKPSSFRIAEQLEEVIFTLSSTANMLQPFFAQAHASQAGAIGAIDQAISVWLMNEVNVLPQQQKQQGEGSEATSERRPSVGSVVVMSSNSRSVRRFGPRGTHSQKASSRSGPRNSLPPLPYPGSPLLPGQMTSQSNLSLSPGFINSPPSPLSETKLTDLLSLIANWQAFDLETIAKHCGASTLVTISQAAFEELGLFQSFSLDIPKLMNFMSAVEAGYKRIPYHSAVHAADVVQAIVSLIVSTPETDVLSPLDLLSLLVAGIVHDLGHEGCNNSYEVATSSEKAIMYNDKSVWENYHLCRAFMLLRNEKYDFLCNLSPSEKKEVRKSIIACVMATDIGQHFDHVGQFRTRAAAGDGFETPDGRQVLKNMIVKIADIGNAGRKFPVYMKWVDRVMEEFYQQGDREKEHGLPVSPFMDRTNPQLQQCQVGFIDYIVMPSYQAWVTAFPASETSNLLQTNALDNRKYWDTHSK